MKIGLISDLHIDLNKAYDVIRQVTIAVKNANVDVLIVAGDISEQYEMTISAMKELNRDCPCPVYYVPGNHDLWNKNYPACSTEEIYAYYKSEENCLCDKVIKFEKNDEVIYLTGEVGWYDYSLANESYTFEEMEHMTYNKRTWQDHYYNQWTENNKKHMQVTLNQIEKQLQACGDGPILAVTHMIPIKNFCVPEEQKDWAYFNGFLGSTAIQELYKKYPVRYAVSGHVHYRTQVMVDGIFHICPCLGYYNEWPLYQLENNDLDTHVAHALYVLDLNENRGEI